MIVEVAKSQKVFSSLKNLSNQYSIPNGCFDAYEVKVNKDIFKYQEKVKVISQFQRSFRFFNGLLEFASFPLNNCKFFLKCLHPLGM